MTSEGFSEECADCGIHSVDMTHGSAGELSLHQREFNGKRSTITATKGLQRIPGEIMSQVFNHMKHLYN